MCAVIAQTHVAYHVSRGHDGKAGVEQVARPEYAFIIFLSALAVVLAHLEEVAAILALLEKFFEQPHAFRVVEKRVVALPTVDDAPPGCPSPDGERGGEKITVGNAWRNLVFVETAHHHNALVVLVAVEHFLAEGEKRLRWYVVVFKDDAFVGEGESPFL